MWDLFENLVRQPSTDIASDVWKVWTMLPKFQIFIPNYWRQLWNFWKILFRQSVNSNQKLVYQNQGLQAGSYLSYIETNFLEGDTNFVNFPKGIWTHDPFSLRELNFLLSTIFFLNSFFFWKKNLYNLLKTFFDFVKLKPY